MTTKKVRNTKKFNEFKDDFVFNYLHSKYTTHSFGNVWSNTLNTSIRLGTKNITIVAIEDNDNEFFRNVLEFNNKRNAKKEVA